MTTRTRRFMVTAMLGMAAWAAGRPPEARGGIVITKAKVQEIADPTFQYEFRVELVEPVIGDAGTDPTVAQTCTLQAGNYFTIYDLYAPPDMLHPGFPPTQPPDWTFSTQLVGPSPVPVTEDPARFNVTWTYSGSPVTGPADLGLFTVTIEQAAPVLLAVYASECGPPGNPEEIVVSVVAIQVVPEPSTFALAGIGGAGIGRRRPAPPSRLSDRPTTRLHREPRRFVPGRLAVRAWVR